MVLSVVVFDFDRTIIDDDSDRWVINQMGLTNLFNQLRTTLPWTSLMDTIMQHLHSNGITIDNIAQSLKTAFLHPNIVSAIKSAHSLGCDLRIISDANLFYIQTILEHHDILGCFSQINTNPTFVDEKGCLHVTPFHDSLSLPPHDCHLCPPNMCKGLVIDRIRGSLAESETRFIYVGDGTGDYCPTLKLGENDFVMPRKNYPLWKSICSDPKPVHAKVHDWSNGEELENILLNLVKKISHIA
ncbi:thiamine phosphate phosphatase-like protein [Lathyrus oleraceus]|uniref:Uncharacterized protein n=1 Tax=Pisum sativum TaxID=3888 RepID=A0A9D4VHV5_PEA|nr:thiamine phosphate phosphatase-like protein [Pisum sativum]KAI5383224.1 hypothetical protein KIW84_070580 [Pisum sativum]